MLAPTRVPSRLLRCGCRRLPERWRAPVGRLSRPKLHTMFLEVQVPPAVTNHQPLLARKPFEMDSQRLGLAVFDPDFEVFEHHSLNAINDEGSPFLARSGQRLGLLGGI